MRIETPHSKRHYTYHLLGMKDIRNPAKHIGVWETLCLFAVNHGVVPHKGAKHVENLAGKAKKLNKHLKDLFKIDESIFKHHYRTFRRYETKIVFSNQTGVTTSQNENEHAESAFELDTEDKKYFSNEPKLWG